MKSVFVLLMFVTGAMTAWGFPIPNEQTKLQTILPQQFNAAFDFEGIVDLRSCSGALVQFEGQSDHSKALVLTNGHCVEFRFPQPGSAYYGRASSRRFSLLNSAARDAATVRTDLLIYATMTQTDMALYRLTETFAEIRARSGIRPFVLSSRHAAVGESMEVISGYWRRGYRCQIETFVYRLLEEGWESQDSIRYSRPGCETIPGTSGSPVVASGTREIIGINNTGNESGGRCTINNPCEIDETGQVYFEKGLSYGQQVLSIYACLTDQFEVDLNKPGCSLPKP
ncbi:MAG: serine protease [Bdellovibrionales bacterium]